MDLGPFDEYYSSQLATNGEKHAEGSEWNFYTINYDAGDTGEAREQQTTAQDLDVWVEARVGLPYTSSGVADRSQTHVMHPGFDLIMAQHKQVDNGDVFYTQLPLTTSRFISIFRKLKLPFQYFHLRGTGGAHCGAFTSDLVRDKDGQILSINFIIRAGHGSSTKFPSMWSFVCTWDAKTRRTTGFLEGVSEATLSELKFHIRACSNILAHPLMLPEILVQLMTTQLNERLRIPCEEAFYNEERRTRLSNLPRSDGRQAAMWGWGFDDFKDVTARTNQYITTTVYIKRRFSHTRYVTQRLLSVLDELGNFDFGFEKLRDRVRADKDERRQRLINRIGILEGYENQTECMLKRIENLNNVLYTVLSQIDSKNQGNLARINLQIAQAVRSDSLPMRTIAYITLLLLPSAFIAAIFGMNFFQFDPETRKLIVAETFWHYWAVSIPVTILVLLIWNVWNYSEKRKGVDDRQSMLFLSQRPDVGGMESLDMNPKTTF